MSLVRGLSGNTMVTRGGTLAVVGISLINAVCFTAIKLGLPYAPPLAFAGLRAFLGGLSLLGLLLVLKQPVFPQRGEWGAIVLIGLVSTTLGFGAMFLSPGRTGAGIASVLANLQPLVTLVLAAIFLNEPLTMTKTAALILGLAGVTFIALPAFSGQSAYGIDGGLLALAVSVGSAMSNILVKRLSRSANLLTVAAWQLLIGSLPLLVASTLVESAQPVRWDPFFLGVLLFLALAGTAFVTAVWYLLLRRHEVGQITLMLFFTPLFGLGIAALVFNENVGVFEGLGVLLILAGIGTTVRKTN